MCKRYIQISGPSGIGKTTLSKDLPGYMGMEDELHFISSSMSDLIPDTKDVSHLDMLSKDPKELYMDDVRLLNLRSKLYRSYIDKDEGYITDRGYLDLATYFFLKQSKHLADCEIEAFLNICLNMLFKHCSRLIVLAYTPKMLIGQLRIIARESLANIFKCKCIILWSLYLSYGDFGYSIVMNMYYMAI